jgi:ABC-2 type transport system ATP-binding protein
VSLPNDIAIRVKGVKKDFILPHEKNSSIKSSIVNVFRKKDTGAETQHALKEITFDVKKGEFFGIVGRNGSGKSTLLKILAQIYQPTAGSVQTRGKVVPFIELGVGFNPELTGKENVYLNGALLGFSRKEIDAKYDEIVEFAELENFMDQKLKNYSSGMQVRLAFSVATRAKSELLIVDEVLAVGDAAFQRKCYEYFQGLKYDENVTVVFVTHDMSAVEKFCDRAILIENGLITEQGDTANVSTKYLRLFQDNSFDEEQDERWGSRLASFKSVAVKTTPSDLRIDCLVEAKGQTKLFKIGYQVTDGSGNVVFGGSSLNPLDGAQWFELKASESKKVSFTMPNILGNGTYYVNAQIVSEDEEVYDQWRKLDKITNLRKNAPYPIVSPANMKVE